jgi:predicted RNA binding protein YcfA (HicA-like mRNA interferase family)
MAVRKVRDITAALNKKGFELAKTHHNYFILYVDGKKTSIRTRISHGKKEYGENLLQAMSKQLKLPRGLFDELLDCPLSYDDYISILKENGDIRIS